MGQDYQDISVEQLRVLQQQGHERDYLVVDVRQEDEYRRGHIPGALLIPLAELSRRAAELPGDRSLIFSCRSGKRSQAAALMIAALREPAAPMIYNMVGGMLAWEGRAPVGMPDLKVFDLGGGATQLLIQAMELERGAERFYLELLSWDMAPELEAPLQLLAQAEQGHARLLHHQLASLQESPLSFAACYDELEGDIIEGGVELASLLASFEEQPESPCRLALELALGIECSAYEMYRALAQRFVGQELEQLLLQIAQAEKEHLQIAAQALAGCPA
ncbi:rhodanese-like domain-containing protein [Desulfogranum mediterraneum]|uniref:rhodanese-like domain-containing protein n=1 Tax=Desulfogranum mediterraneum TaxID=160661 RepID=UPI0004210EB4|nr:rhodanese-like domain-containing protein [Desulfogranum mediterraneum]